MERIDDLQLKGLSIIQDTELFCFGTDAVLLADFVRLKKNARVADLGTGTGILPLLLYGRREDISVQALELQEALCSLCLLYTSKKPVSRLAGEDMPIPYSPELEARAVPQVETIYAAARGLLE